MTHAANNNLRLERFLYLVSIEKCWSFKIIWKNTCVINVGDNQMHGEQL